MTETVIVSVLAASPALIYLRSRRGPLEQIKWLLERMQVLGLALSMAGRDAWRDREYYWRRGCTVLRERK